MAELNHLHPSSSTIRASLKQLLQGRVAVWCLLLLGCSAADPVTEASRTERRPNIVLVMADDLGWGDTSYNGHSTLPTPHLDALAARGITLDRFYAAAPVCSPTRASVLTGRHPYRYGITFANVGHLPAEELTLAELLQGEGYRTGHFGKWHLGTLTRDIQDGRRGGRKNEHYAPPWEHGFDECFSTEQAVATWDPMDAQFLSNPTRYWTGPGQIETENLAGDDSRVIMDRVVPFLERAADADEPFLAVVWLHAPHQPVVAGDEYRARFSERTNGKQHYYGVVSALDEQVGRLQEQLEVLGLAEDTLLWFCSDNGPEGTTAGLKKADNRYQGSAGPYRGRKRSLYEGGVRVPGILVWPGHIAPGTRTSFPMVTSDYLPTIVDLLGLELPPGRPLDGISLLPALNGQQELRAAPIGFESKRQLAWTTDRYKLVSQDGGETFELYNPEEDPGESLDLAPMQPEVVERLRRDLEAWRRSCLASVAGADYATRD